MKIRIVAPNTKLFAPLIENKKAVEEKYDAELFVASEKQTREIFADKRADIALLTPIGYGMGIKFADYRVIPGPALAIEAYSGLMNINFKPGLESFNSICLPNEDEFGVIASKIILAERYGLSPSYVIKKIDDTEYKTACDAYFTYGLESAEINSIDITDDWFDSFTSPLLMGFWVTRYEEHPDEVIQIVNDLAADDLLNPEPVDEILQDKDYSGRSGAIHWRWDESWETPGDDLLEMLYFNGYLPEIGDIKILGKNYEEH
eukprot:TRINITY_DN28421_c0_g1_i1.p1 TRINITY_DN28421_c0_g1~~TRINITY_DN28421_c0_g1_i1.p1  ORF type:complete len:261 (-),score=-26.21 TRINITY_DN28421_c0_g1_i1:137-919(-)